MGKCDHRHFTVAFKRDGTLAVVASKAKENVLRLMIDSLTQTSSEQGAEPSSSHAPKHVNTSEPKVDYHAQGKRTLETQTVDHVQSVYNESRVFYCTDTAVIKDLPKSLSLSDIPDKLYNTDRENGEFCVHIDNRIQPFHVIDGHKNNSLVSLLDATVGLTPHDENPSHSRSTNSPPQSNSSAPENGFAVRADSSRPADAPATMGVPRLIHYVWFGLAEMTFGMYLSFLSSVYVVKPDAVLIHGDGRLYGEFWEKVRRHPLVTLVYREPPLAIYSRAVVYTSHRSDVVRADVLDKYGGVYLDWDAYWLRSPEQYLAPARPDTNSTRHTTHLEQGDVKLQRRVSEAGAVVSRDHMPRPPFPDTINMGVVLARPRSKFIRAWRAALVDYRSRDFLYNAVELPYKIYESFPRSVRIDDRLQVMCYYLKCHPSYQPGFKQWNHAQPFNWTSDGVSAIHFTHPDPPAFHNLTALLSASGTFADIGRFIWSLQPEAERPGSV
ncbi:hypothetical protein EGW08_010304 [Elysia chlorotica]|uniref:Nucleotide-diphospho-sugar transferase domain-containing protein n=1 Tax=Elysia chlorotica TaxID=188477 RepID=A0A433TK29_ELYCH|nr:hypothetical protein EGW08_010304 [Elysia chlorotica]